MLLVGGSSVGKTRSVFEAVRALLPDWWLVHPAGPGELARPDAAAVPRVVVWLDELQHYLDGEHGLTGGVIRALLGDPHPAVIIGTLWPDRYASYTAVPAPGDAHPHARERQVLDLATVVRIDPEFSRAERDRARVAAARDPRIGIGLGAAGYGLTQTLAAAPQLVARWEDAQTASPYGWAVLTAALDAARLGTRAPLSTEFLRAAAPGYCTGQQRAEAPGNWLERALAYATEKLHGAVAALSPAGDDIMDRVAGYTMADYLDQHGRDARRTKTPPDTAWQALVDFHHPEDAVRIAEAAEHRGRYRHAAWLLHRAAERGDVEAMVRMAACWSGRGGRTRPPPGGSRVRLAVMPRPWSTSARSWSGRAAERKHCDGGWRPPMPAPRRHPAGRRTTWRRHEADGGNSYALEEIAALLDREGQEQQARHLRRYGWEPDGTIAGAWQAPVPPALRVMTLRAPDPHGENHTQ